MNTNGEYTFTGKWGVDDSLPLGLTPWGRDGGRDFTLVRQKSGNVRSETFQYSGTLPTIVQEIIAEACSRVLAGEHPIKKELVLNRGEVTLRVNVFSCRGASGLEISNDRS